MRVPLIPVIILLLVGLLVDWYIYSRMRRDGVSRLWRQIYVAVSGLATAAILVVTIAPKKGADDAGLGVLMWTLFSYFTIYIPKFVCALFLVVRQLLGRLMRRRLRGLTIAGSVIAVIIFLLMWWGALINRYRLDVNEVEINIAGLPEKFDGYRIVQISDIHTGTYGNDTTFLKKMVDRVNELKPDVIFFTGDIVNRHSSELNPFIATLSQLHAPDGVISVMGNHDYGDYYSWPSPEAKRDDVLQLFAMQADMGWRMLNNAHEVIHRGGSDSLVVIGVENIGDPPFTIYGNLGQSYPRLSDESTKILLSHNPRHWVDSIANRADVNITLTLSGHTHAMQMELFGWSPATFRYKTWGGLYPDNLGRQLYVNIGLGEVGIPARIGATPEITLITLRP